MPDNYRIAISRRWEMTSFLDFSTWDRWPVRSADEVE